MVALGSGSLRRFAEGAGAETAGAAVAAGLASSPLAIVATTWPTLIVSPFLAEAYNSSRVWAGNFDDRLVGFQLKQAGVGRDLIALLD